MPLELEYQRFTQGRWMPLSIASTTQHSDWQMFGWATVLGSGSFRANEVSMPPLNNILDALRKRQAKSDAPAVLDKLEESGNQVWLKEDGTIGVKGPALDDDTKDDIRRCKPQLIELLKERPQWDDAEAMVWEQKIKDAHQLVYKLLHPHTGSPSDDCFAAAARNVFADLMTAFVRAKSARRIDLLRRRVDFILGWLATLDSRIHDLRDPKSKEWRKNRESINSFVAEMKGIQ